jgi:hypothetical protein
MLNIKGSHRNDVTPVIQPIKRVAIGAELDELQNRLARLRRQTEVFPKTPAVVVTTRH